MKRFTFSFERLLRIKKIGEDAAMRRLGQEMSIRNAYQGELSEANDLKRKFMQRFGEKNQEGPLDPTMVRRYQTYQFALERGAQELKGKLDKHEGVVDEARDKLKNARCQTQIYEKIRARQREVYLRESAKEELKELGELSLNRHHRRDREQGSAANVVLAISASCFLGILLFTVLLFFLGFLTPHKLAVIANVLGYKDANFKEDRYLKPDLHLIVGEQDPYVISNATYSALKGI
ncbi:MAG: flagellar export protein FliJ, partial [Planctomycetes bacterium]|nr:flagellar export protein FliJ [Planctomycetota bacterium]